MSETRILTGIKPTGEIHIGNYLGCIRPTLALLKEKRTRENGPIFIADGHALTGFPSHLSDWTYDVAAAWIACGLDPQANLLYRQSHIPALFPLYWILSCFTPKGLMNRAHAYKALAQHNQDLGREDLDIDINMGLYTYPILMAADILALQADQVPVGADQQQHLEIAREIARRVNHHFNQTLLKEPAAYIQADQAVIPGLDGRKMSKSYHNTIPLFCSADVLRKKIYQIKTTSQDPSEPKDPDTCLLFRFYTYFASSSKTEVLRQQYQNGISWKDVKDQLFEVMDDFLSPLRAQYIELQQDRVYLDAIFREGEERAQMLAQETLEKLYQAVGFRA